MRRLRHTALACAAAVALGCGAMAAARAQATGAGVALSQPTLSAVLAQMLDADPQVRSARATLDIALARSRQAQSRYWPSAGLVGAAGHSTDRELDNDVQRRTERLEGVLRWNLYNGGADRSEIAATEREVASAQAEFDRARGEVSERIADAWIDAQKFAAIAAASRRRLHDVARLTNQIVTQGAAGRLSETDVLQAQVALSESQVSHEFAIAESEAARAKLETLVGRPLDGFVAAGFPPLNVPESVVHPSLRAARERADAAAARRRQLAEALAPRLDLEIRQRLIDRTDPAPTTALRRGATVAMTWDVPLGGEPFAKQDEAQRRVEQAQAEAERVDLLLRADLASLRMRERASYEAVERGRAQVEQSLTLLRAANVQFESGRRTVQQVVQARDSQFLAEQRHTEALARMHQLRLRQWSTAGALLAVVGQAPGLPGVTAVTPPVMDLAPASAALAASVVVSPSPLAATATRAPAAASAPAMTFVPASPRPTPAASALPMDAAVMAEISQRTNRWLAAWKARDVEGYLAFYGSSFVPAKGLSRTQWELQRRRVLGQAGRIEIDLGALRFEPGGERVTVEFDQAYRSDAYRDKVRKRMEWAREDGAWRIVSESSL